MNQGWIKLHRKSLEHWLYNENRPHTKREAWEDMLLLCNHADEKVFVEGELIECNRGQSVMSLKSWANTFKWTIQQVRTFFNLLKNDEMIRTDGLRKTTRVTICNYEHYQNNQQADNTQTTHRQHTDNTQTTTNKNEEELKNDKNEIPPVWKKDFDVYKKELRNEYKRLIADTEWISQQEKFNPGVDIQKSIEKSCVNFWATEGGWKKKKGTKIVNIDWKATFANAVSQPMNKVYKDRSAPEPERKKEPYKPEKW